MKKLFLLITTLFLFSKIVFAQSGRVPPAIPFGPTNSGKEYCFTFPANWELGATTKYCRLYISAGVRTKVTIYVGPKVAKNLYTIPYDIVTYDLPNGDAQVFTRNDASPVPDDQVYPNKAVKVIANSPIIVYGMNRTSYTSDGMLLLPNNGLGKEYVIASAAEIGTSQRLPSQFMIAAPYDETEIIVTLPPSQSTPNHKGIEGPYNFSMNSGDVFSAMSDAPLEDLTGTLIQSSKPIAVFGGQNCTYLPDARFPACDHIEEQMLPVSTWGKIYHSIPFTTRVKTDMYRVFAGADSTTIYINGAKWGTLPKKGGDEGKGWFNYLHNKRELIEFTADKPIYVAQYNNSQNWDNVVSDPFYLVLTPVEQYQNQLIFSTPSGDFPGNYINLVADSSGYADIEIAEGGSDKWDKLAAKKGYDTKRFPSRINGVTYVAKPFEIKPGTYRLRGPKPFAGYIYGFGSYDSYGYPLSVALGDLTRPDKVAPVIKDTIDCFGNYQATTTDLPDDNAIRSNISTIDLDPDASYNYELTTEPFVPGNTREVKYSLKVTDILQSARAVVVISDQAGNYTLDTVNYEAFNVKITPTPINFGTLFPGSKVNKKVTVTNLAETEVTIQSLFLKFNNQGFKLLSPTGSFTLAKAGEPNSSIVANIEFTATTNGKFIDSLGFENCVGKKFVVLVKAEVGMPIIKVSDKDFGKHIIGKTSAAEFIEITNVGDMDLTVTGHTGGPKGVEFKVPGGYMPFPFTLAPAEVKTLEINFTAGAVVKYADSIVFTHNAPANPSNDPVGLLWGEGIQPQLVATNYDWGRKRVNSGWVNAVVWLKNFGTAPAIIQGATFSKDVNDFRLTQQSIDDLSLRTIQPNDSFAVNVQFNPSTTAARQMIVDYNVSQGPQGVKSILDGFGTIPMLTTQDYDYGSMEVGTTTPSDRDVEFQATGQFLDSVTITEWKFVNQTPENDFSSSVTVNVPLTPPIVLKPGNNKITMKGSFIAKAVGNRKATMTAVTNDGVDATSTWTGNGFSLSTSITGVGGRADNICAPKDTIINAEVSNNGQKDMKVTNLRLVGLSNEFTLMATTNFTLKPGEKRILPIKYSPTGVGGQSGKLEVTHDAQVPNPLLLDIGGSSITESVSSSVSLVGTKNGIGEVGGTLECSIKLNAAFSSLASVKNVKLTVNYDAEQLIIDEKTIALGGASNGGSYTIDPSTRSGVLILNIVSNNGFTVVGELVKFTCLIQLNDKLIRSIDVAMQTGNGCTTISPSTTTVDVEPICGLNLRAIELINGSYALQQNSPNPFNPTTKIRYSLGLDGKTEMLLRDANGKVIQTLINEYQKPGLYELTLDVKNLASGNYYYTVKSGVWSETKMLTIVK